MRLKLMEGGVEVAVTRQDVGGETEHLPGVFEGAEEEVSIAFNPRYLQDGVTAISGDSIRIRVIDVQAERDRQRRRGRLLPADARPGLNEGRLGLARSFPFIRGTGVAARPGGQSPSGAQRRREDQSPRGDCLSVVAAVIPVVPDPASSATVKTQPWSELESPAGHGAARRDRVVQVRAPSHPTGQDPTPEDGRPARCVTCHRVSP